MKNKKGFTLIELLAVIVILGILMLLAIPSVTQNILNTRKSAYLETIQKYRSAAAIKINTGEYSFHSSSTTYYININDLPLETGGNSPFGDWKAAYVVVTYEKDNYKFYWTSVDSAGYRVDLGKEIDNITESDIYVSNNLKISLNGLGSRTAVKVIDKNS